MKVEVYDMSAFMEFIHVEYNLQTSTLFSPMGGCAVPGGRCNTGPTLRGEKQASTNQADSKNRLISMVSLETVPEIKPIRTDTTH